MLRLYRLADRRRRLGCDDRFAADLFRRGRVGFPVLVARRDVAHFDFSQLSAFLTHASDRMAEEGVSVPRFWVIASTPNIQKHTGSSSLGLATA